MNTVIVRNITFGLERLVAFSFPYDEGIKQDGEIEELLGHASSVTIEIFTHASTRNLQKRNSVR